LTKKAFAVIKNRIEEKQQLVDANKKLIRIYQDKIKEKIDDGGE